LQKKKGKYLNQARQLSTKAGLLTSPALLPYYLVYTTDITFFKKNKTLEIQLEISLSLNTP